MPELFEHQAEGIRWRRQTPFGLLADEPGLGKSAQELLAIEKEPVLIVAPAMVLDSGTWDDEIDKWASGLEAIQVAYSSLNAREKTARGGTRPTEHLKPEFRRRWGKVICDEAHYVKGRKTSWTKAVFKLDTGAMSLDTGTPISNWAHEAFTLLQLSYPAETRPGKKFGSYWRWAKEWFQVAPTHWSPMDVGDLRPDRTWEEFRAANWGDRHLLRLREQCLDLPPLTMKRFKVKMGPAQRKAYRELEKDFVTWLDSGVEIVAWNSAAQLIKLVKASMGLEVLDPTVKGSAKLDALRALLKDRSRPTLVVAYFQHSVEACARAAEEIGLEARVIHGGTSRARRREFVRSFQSGNLPVLCASIETIAEGMTLTAADQVIRAERSWKPSKNEQVIYRLQRIGQQRPVSAIDLVSEDTIDEGVLGLLEKKTDHQMKALGKEELRRVALK
jgi:SNF2 family DNA or RNA helicase